MSCGIGTCQLRDSELGAEQTWNTQEFANLEAKVLGEQGTNGPKIDLTRE